MFYFRPVDYKYNFQGQDIYENFSLKSYALATRLGVNVTGYQYGSMKVDGKIETDFYLMNGSTASLRLRHAFVDVYWDKLGYMESKVSFRVGQSWHPMAADLPYCVNVETGAPFTPFNWSPQLMFDFAFAGKFHYTVGALYPMQFLPTGPQGESENYVKYGLIPRQAFHRQGWYGFPCLATEMAHHDQELRHRGLVRHRHEGEGSAIYAEPVRLSPV